MLSLNIQRGNQWTKFNLSQQDNSLNTVNKYATVKIPSSKFISEYCKIALYKRVLWKYQEVIF